MKDLIVNKYFIKKYDIKFKFIIKFKNKIKTIIKNIFF